MIKVLYYIVFGIIAAIGLYFVVSSLFGRYILWNASPVEAKIVLIVATAVACRIMYKAYLLGDVQNRWCTIGHDKFSSHYTAGCIPLWPEMNLFQSFFKCNFIQSNVNLNTSFCSFSLCNS
jgi:hypothetical protein